MQTFITAVHCVLCVFIPLLFFFGGSVLGASVAQLAACLADDQEVVGCDTRLVGKILSWRLIMKYFLLSFSPFH